MKKDIQARLKSIREKRERGEKLSKKEEQIWAYAHPAGCPSCYRAVKIEA